ncbi:MAG: hypothetical protein A2014_03605 [Spirochaetes bacterium GWF1_49_6]|nr:MAG: hypothetical protein A2014_03605 [Spirochaetes bacterium GWF1_49_6]
MTIVFVVNGVIFLVLGILVYFHAENGSAALQGTNIQNNPAVAEQMTRIGIQYGVSILFFVISSVLLVLSVIGLIKKLNKSRLAKRILQTGIETDALVTYVDRNFSILINKQPVYSIVEYRYRDNDGNKYTERLDRVSSEMVVRSNIEVGCTIRIKYLQEDHAKSEPVLS